MPKKADVDAARQLIKTAVKKRFADMSCYLKHPRVKYDLLLKRAIKHMKKRRNDASDSDSSEFSSDDDDTTVEEDLTKKKRSKQKGSDDADDDDSGGGGGGKRRKKGTTKYKTNKSTISGKCYYLTDCKEIRDALNKINGKHNLQMHYIDVNDDELEYFQLMMEEGTGE